MASAIFLFLSACNVFFISDFVGKAASWDLADGEMANFFERQQDSNRNYIPFLRVKILCNTVLALHGNKRQRKEQESVVIGDCISQNS
jgi:hypothetical protein